MTVVLVIVAFLLGGWCGVVVGREEDHCLEYSPSTGECLESVTTEEIVDTYLKENRHA